MPQPSVKARTSLLLSYRSTHALCRRGTDRPTIAVNCAVLTESFYAFYAVIHTYIRFNEKISQDTQDQRPLTCDLNTKEIEKQLNYGNTTNCERSMLFNRLLKLSEDGASTTYSGNIFQISQTRLQKKYLWAFTLDWCLYL